MINMLLKIWAGLKNHSGGLYGPTTSLWWPAWTHKITVACGGLHGPTKSLWHVVACMVPQNHCGGMWWPAVTLCLLNPLSYINILIKHYINLVMHYKFEILWGGECKT